MIFRRWVLISSILLIGFFSLVPPYGNRAVITSDGVGYHLWTRAILEWDFRFCDLVDLYGGEMRGRVSHMDERRGICGNKYPPGVALLRLPLMAPFVNLKDPAKSQKLEDKISTLESFIAFSLVCIFCSQVLIALGVSARLADQVVFFGAFGTGLFHYSAVEGSFSHVYSALMFAALLKIYLTAPRRQFSGLKIIGSFIVAALIVLMRNVNVIALILAGVAVWDYQEQLGGQRIARRKILPIALGAVAGLTLQLIYNCYVSGELTFSSYMREPFLWSDPHQSEVAFSYQRGLFTYYPIMALACVAATFEASSRKAAIYFVNLLVSFIIVYGFWSSWMLGHGFGHRGFIDFSPFMIVLLGFALSRMSKRGRQTFLVAGALCTIATFSLMVGHWHGTLPPYNANYFNYWDTLFGRGLRVTCLVGAAVLFSVIEAIFSERRQELRAYFTETVKLPPLA